METTITTYKMEKLTLEYIAPYLPYDVSVISGNNGKQRKVTFKNVEDFEHIHISSLLGGIGHKLALREMDLSRPIIIDNEEVFPLCFIGKMIDSSYKHLANDNEGNIIFGYYGEHESEILCWDHESKTFYSALCFEGDMDNIHGHKVHESFYAVQWLFKHKFDVFGLIEKGLAIDVNTLTTNPYN